MQRKRNATEEQRYNEFLELPAQEQARINDE
jgi:hypothetical protein